jgi:hypothetical protein
MYLALHFCEWAVCIHQITLVPYISENISNCSMPPQTINEIKSAQYNYQDHGTATVPQPRISKPTKGRYKVYEAPSSVKI